MPVLIECSRSMLLVVALTLLVSCEHGVENIEDKSNASGDFLRFDSPSGVYRMQIDLNGFKFSFSHSDDSTLIAAHTDSGLVFAGAAAQSAIFDQLGSNDTQLEFEVTNSLGGKAQVTVYLLDNTVRISVIPKTVDGAVIKVRLGGIANPVYGLADDGRNVNVFGVNDKAIENDGAHDRFVSTFAIAPTMPFAQVVMVQQDERFLATNSENMPHRVNLNQFETSLAVQNTRGVKHFYYFFGDVKSIYQAFSQAKREAGYPDVKPLYGMFGVGWEAWPLLSWKTNENAVKTSVQAFLDRGYSLAWAVVGSGFWEKGGTTTSFGRWNQADDRYPDPKTFQAWFDAKGLKLMLGLRTQFVDGLGVNSGIGRNGSRGVYLAGSEPPSEYREGINREYFSKTSDELFRTASEVFPQWDKDFVLLDSAKSDAVRWYREGTALWGVDGWKEDTMLTSDAHVYHDGHWNPIMKALHDRGDFVMARNAYVSSPGSIQRLNDTNGEEARIPQLVLAYGASGAPNIYTDIIGNHAQQNAQYLERHAKLQALTAGMSFGVEPWKLSQDVADNIKAAANWHNRYQPYLYSEALKSFASGYPYTATPLPMVYPQDERVYNLDDKKMWQWMVGESMLVHPLFDSTETDWKRDVYLPAGSWMDYNTLKLYQGPLTLVDYDHSGPGLPVFIGGKGIIVHTDSEAVYVEVWPVDQSAAVQYEYHHHESNEDESGAISTITLNNTGWDRDKLTVTEKDTGEPVVIQWQDGRAAMHFLLVPGNSYVVSGG